METIFKDVRYGFRMLSKSLGFTIVTIISLAIGIGANTAIFSVVNAVLLKPLPVAEPSRVVALYTSDYSGPLYGTSSYPDYLEFRNKSDVLSGLVGYTIRPMSMSAEGQAAERVFGEIVTGNYFDVLGVRAGLGRTFLPEEDSTPGTHPVVVISHDLWQKRFNSDPGLIGKTITLNGQPLTVVGIASQNYKGLLRGISTDLWVPIMMEPQLVAGSKALQGRGDRWLFLLGRLKPGVTIEQARASFAVLASQLHDAYPDQWTNVRHESRSLTVLPESEARVFPALRGAVLGFTGMLMAVVGLVLLIACANVANLLLARATGRRREIAIRLALGARRARLIRQLLTESLLLSLLSGALGFLLALWLTDLINGFKPPVPVPVALDMSVDARILLFTLGISLFTGLLFGLAPAMQASKPDVIPALKEEGSSSMAYHKSRLRNTFVVVQVAISLVLLISASLFLRSLSNASAINPGFNPRNVITMSFDLGSQGYKEEQGLQFYQQLLERARSLPGVQSASLASEVPLGLGGSRRGVAIEGHERQPGEDMEFHYTQAGPGYFHTMGIPLVRGRDFSEEDRVGTPGVAIVNETMAGRFWPGQDPIGKRLSVSGDEGPYLEIVGVVKDGKYVTLGEEPLPFFSIPFLQNYESGMTLLVRTNGDPKTLIPGLRAQVQTLDKNLPISDVKTLTEHMSLSLLPARIASTVLGIFGGLALLLAGVGIYGVISYAVSQRTREIGIRMALGAQRGDVLKLVVGQGMLLALIGIILGLVAAFFLTRFLASLLYGVSATDVLTFTLVPVLWLIVALIASYIPARRATKVDPIVALRYE